MLTAAESTALAISLKVALLSIVVALPFALALGLALSRLRFPGKSVLEALLNLPLVLPPVVTGYALLIGQRYGQRPPCPKRNPGKRSITELEYARAIERDAAVLVFVLGDGYPLPAADTDRTAGLVRMLEAFRRRAKSLDGTGSGVCRVYKVVNSIEELRQAAERGMQALASFLAQREVQSRPQSPEEPLLILGPADVTRAASAGGAEGAPPPAPPAPCTVPAYIGSHAFVGRSAELDLLDDWAAAEDQHPMLLFDAIGGSGKSMLTWHWFATRAPALRPWAGRFWYSFYEGGASMTDCCRQAVAYITHQPVADLQQRPWHQLTRELLDMLAGRPWLLVLDGLERVLVAYHRSDAATIADESLERPTDQMGERNPSTAVRPEDDDLLRQLTAAGQSKILVTSRLMPQALLNRAQQPIPGVRRESLRGLRPEDAVLLLQRCGVRGDPTAMRRFQQEHCDGHPLVVGALAGLIVEPIPASGDFDVWVKHPEGGASLDLGKLDLVQKRNHILRAAIAAVPEKGRELLATLALLHGGVDREAMSALNPHLPPEPEGVSEPEDPEASPSWSAYGGDVKAMLRSEYLEHKAARDAFLEAHRKWLALPELRAAPVALVATLRGLLGRGLLQVGAVGESHFDLHPVVRGIVSAGLDVGDTVRLGQRVVDHFSQRAHDPYENAESLKDLVDGFHVMRSLLRMKDFQGAVGQWRGDLSNAVLYNVRAFNESLALLKPFFPGGWYQRPEGVDGHDESYLMNYIALMFGELCDVSGAARILEETVRLDAAASRWMCTST